MLLKVTILQLLQFFGKFSMFNVYIQRINKVLQNKNTIFYLSLLRSNFHITVNKNSVCKSVTRTRLRAGLNCV